MQMNTCEYVCAGNTSRMHRAGWREKLGHLPSAESMADPDGAVLATVVVPALTHSAHAAACIRQLAARRGCCRDFNENRP